MLEIFLWLVGWTVIPVLLCLGILFLSLLSVSSRLHRPLTGPTPRDPALEAAARERGYSYSPGDAFGGDVLRKPVGRVSVWPLLKGICSVVVSRKAREEGRVRMLEHVAKERRDHAGKPGYVFYDVFTWSSSAYVACSVYGYVDGLPFRVIELRRPSSADDDQRWDHSVVLLADLGVSWPVTTVEPKRWGGHSIAGLTRVPLQRTALDGVACVTAEDPRFAHALLTPSMQQWLAGPGRRYLHVAVGQQWLLMTAQGKLTPAVLDAILADSRTVISLLPPQLGVPRRFATGR